MQKLMIDPDVARDHIQSNWPNDPLLRTIGLNLVDTLPKEKAVKVDKREGCSFCREMKAIATHVDGKAEIVEMIPLPAIDLTTGETHKAADPFFAIRIESYENGEDFVPIEFCPKCGRDLKEDS